MFKCLIEQGGIIKSTNEILSRASYKNIVKTIKFPFYITNETSR